MGQRLNIEIHNNGELLANSYFHWSAYTSSSIELVKDILDSYEECVCNCPVQRAVWLLELTGAGINETEKDMIQRKEDNKLKHLRFNRISNDRNRGFIHVDDEEMYNTRHWDEGRVYIDIENETIRFDVLYNDTVDYMLEEMEWEEDELPDHINIDQLGCMMGEDWSFDEFYTFVNLYEDNPGGFQWTAPDGTDMVCYWIE